MPDAWRQLESNQTARLCTFDIESAEKRVVYQTAGAVIEAPNWAPDNMLVYNSDGLLYQVPCDGSSQPAPIGTGDIRDANNDHVLSPDGRFVYLSAGDGHLYEVAIDGGLPRRVSNTHEEPFQYFLHGISPDGEILTYTGARGFEGDAFGSLDLFTIPVAGGSDTQLTRFVKPSDGPEFSPDGTWIYFNSELASSAPGHSQLFRMRTDGTEVTQLTKDERVNWFPHLSPDGDKLVYLSYGPGTTGHPANQGVVIRSMNPDGGSSHDLVSLCGGQGTINVNSWAPDNRRFAYVDYPVI
jgi:hypothetical protein